jgi:hypothetical protein
MAWARGIAAGLAGAVLAAAANGPARPQAVDVGAPVMARGAAVSEQQENTAAGRPLVLFHYVHIDDRCGPAPAAIRVATPPEHGALEIEDGEERPWTDGRPLFAATDARAHCADRLAATKDGVYTPAPGFRGHDTLVLQFTEDGASFTDTIDVAVR